MTGIVFDPDIMGDGFGVIIVIAGLKKMRANEKKKSPPQANEQTKKDKESPVSTVSISLFTYKQKLEQLSRQVKDKVTQGKVRDIARLLGMIAKEVEEDPRDKSKVRSLSDHTGEMVVDLVQKYVKMEAHDQEVTNAASAMEDIKEALIKTEKSLKGILEDLLSNDMAEVSSTISVLENILSSEDTSNRIRMEAVKETKEDDKK